MKSSIFARKNEAVLYIVLTLVISWSIELLGLRNENSRGILLLIMFIPSIIAIILQKIYGTSIRQYFIQSFKRADCKSIMFAVLYPIAIVLACAIVSVLTGLGKFNTEKMLNINRFINFLINSILTLLPALGEEYGWRAYLLPKLEDIHGRLKAAIYLGIVWVLYHIPVIYLLSDMGGTGSPILSTLLQACSLITLSFAFTYCYYISESIVPVTIIHGLWNSANTWILGDIFSHKSAMVEGNIFLINGEGLMGMVLGTLPLIFFISSLNKQGWVNKKSLDCK